MQRTTALFIPLFALAGAATLATPSAQAATPETELDTVLNPDAAVHPFVANYGQDDPSVLFAARSFGGTVAIREGDIGLSLAAHAFAPRSSTTIRFLSAPALDAFEGEPAKAKANFYLGAEPQTWLEDLPTHADVDLYELAPGVDLQVDASGRDMRWLATSSDPGLLADLRWAYDNATSVEVDGEGRLQVTLPAYDEQGYELPEQDRTLTLAAPRAWQDIEGELSPVAVDFVVEAGVVSLALVDAEPGLATQVELMTRYAPRHGAADSQRASAGTGAVGTSDPFSPATGDFDTDMLSLSLDDGGRQITGLTVIGGAGSSAGAGLGQGSGGRIWLAGSTDADDFPTFAAVQPWRAGGRDATLVELDASGHLLSSSYFGGPGDDAGADLEVDPQGRLWLTGTASEPIEGPALTLPYGTAFAAGGQQRELFLTAIDSGGLTVEGTGCFGGQTPGGTPPTVTVDTQGAVWIGVRGTINQSPRTVVTYSESAPHTGAACTRNGDGWGAEALCWKHNASGVAYTPANLPPAPGNCGFSPALSSQCHDDLNDAEANPQVFPTDPAGSWEGPFQLGLNEINIAQTGEEVMIAAALYMHRWGSPVYGNGYTQSSPTDEQAIGFHHVSFDAASDPATNCDWLGFQDTSVPGWQNYPIYQVAANCDAHRQLSVADTNISYWDWSGIQVVGYTSSRWIGPGTPWWVPPPISNPPNFYAFDKSQVYIGDPPKDEAFMAAHISEYANLAADGVVEDMQIARTWFEGGEAVGEQLATEQVHPR